MAVLRKLLGGMICLYENGFSYTWYHGWEKIGRRILQYGRESLPYREVRRRVQRLVCADEGKGFFNSPQTGKNGVVALFALYCPSGEVPEYVFSYIRELRKIAGRILVCADSAVDEPSFERMKSCVDGGVFGRHGEYDFGSYRRAYALAESHGILDRSHMLILANDSCLCPLAPLGNMFADMAKRDCDFWGQTSYSFHGRKHVQSYFLVFNERLVGSGDVWRFLSKVGGAQARSEVISSYEIGLTEFLVSRGYRWQSYVPYRAVLKNPTCSPCMLIRRFACPLVKIKALVGESFENLAKVHRVVSESNEKAYREFEAVAGEWEQIPEDE